MVLFLAFRTLTPLPTGTANVVPAPDSRVPLRPPGAFAKRKDLTAKVRLPSCLCCYNTKLSTWWMSFKERLAFVAFARFCAGILLNAWLIFLQSMLISPTIQASNNITLCRDAAFAAQTIVMCHTGGSHPGR